MRDREEAYAVLVIGPVLGRDDLAALCARVDQARGGAPPGSLLVVLCDVAGLQRADMVALDVLARLRMHAVRAGGTLRLWRAGPRLRLLLELTGLRAVLPSHPDGAAASADELGGLVAQQHGRQPEQGEEPLGVEEVVDPGDPPG